MEANTLFLILVLALVALVVLTVVRAVQIIPQATAAVVERLGRFRAVEEPGLVFLVPFVDKIRERIDLREQVRSFPPQPVITKDNLTVNIDTVVYYQVTEPKSAVYEIADYINGVEQTTTTTLRNVVGGMSLEETLTARDEINSQLRGELDKVTGNWGIRIARVEIKAIEPPASIQDSMERQMKADREKRAMILTAEGQRESAIRSAEGQKQSQILTAEGAKQAAILNAEAERQSRILRAQGVRAARYLEAQGQAKAIEKVFAAIKSGRPTPELLAYQYLQTLPQMAQGDANKVWIVPSDFGKALEGFAKMLGAPGEDGVFRFQPSPADERSEAQRPEDDDESIKDWFDTSSDPEIARLVADAQAQARAAVPPPGLGEVPPVPSVAPVPPRGVAPPARPQALPSHLPPPADGPGTGRAGRHAGGPGRRGPSGADRPAAGGASGPGAGAAGGRPGAGAAREPESAVPTPPRGWPATGAGQQPGTSDPGRDEPAGGGPGGGARGQGGRRAGGRRDSGGDGGPDGGGGDDSGGKDGPPRPGYPTAPPPL